MSAAISLWEALGEVPDPRQASGRRYPLQAVLTLASVALLSGSRSLYAIAQFGRDYGPEFARAMGFAKGTTPCCTALHYLFIALDAAAFERAVQKWLRAQHRAGWRAVALDGKTLRGTQGDQVPGVHLLAAYAHEAGAVLGQLSVQSKTNEHKAALRLLKLIPVKDAVVTGDAMFCQRDLSRQVRQKGGHYLWAVKDNQPTLKEQIAEAFHDVAFSPSGPPLGGSRAPRGLRGGQGTRARRTTNPSDDHGSERVQ
jgi:3-hydroxymyristoyl/3-hydroxydecanoyl-(acyl carrier protein) dehydratase